MVIHGSLRRLKVRVDSLRHQGPICNLNDKLPLFATGISCTDTFGFDQYGS